MPQAGGGSTLQFVFAGDECVLAGTSQKRLLGPSRAVVALKMSWQTDEAVALRVRQKLLSPAQVQLDGKADLGQVAS